MYPLLRIGGSPRDCFQLVTDVSSYLFMSWQKLVKRDRTT